MASPSAPVPLPRLLAACADELTDLAGRCEALQGALSPGLGPAALKDAQALDLVTQSLAALAQYAQALAAAAPAGWALDPTAAAQGLPLAAMAARLTGADHLAETGGELFLFEDVP